MVMQQADNLAHTQQMFLDQQSSVVSPVVFNDGSSSYPQTNHHQHHNTQLHNSNQLHTLLHYLHPGLHPNPDLANLSPCGYPVSVSNSNGHQGHHDHHGHVWDRSLPNASARPYSPNFMDTSPIVGTPNSYSSTRFSAPSSDRADQFFKTKMCIPFTRSQCRRGMNCW